MILLVESLETRFSALAEQSIKGEKEDRQMIRERGACSFGTYNETMSQASKNGTARRVFFGQYNTQFCVQFVHPTKEWSEGNPIIHTDDVSLHACFTAYSGTALD